MALADAPARDGRKGTLVRWIRSWGCLLALGCDATPHFTPHAAAEMPAATGAQTQTLLDGEFECFLRQYERNILNYLWRLTGDEQTAYDLAQETFLRAWQRYESLRGYEQPRGWLFHVATNLALTHLRRRRRFGSLTMSVPEDAGVPETSDVMGQLAESDHVRRTLLALAPRRRAALVLREVYGLSAADVGRVLGMSATAVRMELHRARAQFRAVYLREGGDGDGD